MTQTVFITGASSGIGLATAQLFQRKGWNVVATMRNPDPNSALAQLPNVVCSPLDVTATDTIAPAITNALAKFGAIDALVNNAGYALIGPLEACSVEEIQQQFATNVFGLISMVQAMLPHMRQRRQGVIVNVASVGGRVAFPIYSAYHASKWAVDGMSESLQYELRDFNIRVKIIEPGPIKTDFYSRSLQLAQKPGLDAYEPYIAATLPQMNRAGETGSPPDVTAKVIWHAVTDGSWRLRYPAGGNAGLLLTLRKLLPDAWWTAFLRSQIERRPP
jgi:NAD(P)-dependent dehydrogenase (short-subunit alcohol dehydrogenase family)